ncbi:MAG: DUF4395 domain-containing protein [Frankiales bacterium]|nr:DUF4395 domain-containing protein [Frankiales bacterium]
MTATTADGFFTFPEHVDERAVRVTATGVALLTLVAIVARRPELFALVAYGFWARVLAGPRLSPLALFATRVVTPRLEGPPRLVAGPPKRFAQAMGAATSTLVVLLYFAAHEHTAAYALASVMVVLATLEAGFRICVGCLLHAWLVRRGVIRAEECADCSDVRLRIGAGR